MYIIALGQNTYVLFYNLLKWLLHTMEFNEKLPSTFYSQRLNLFILHIFPKYFFK